MQTDSKKHITPTDANNVLAVRSCALEKDDMGDDLCKHCPLEKKGVYGVDGGYMAGCEGSRCDDAYDNYLEIVSGSIFKYLEIKSYEDGRVVKRLDVTGKSDRQVDRIESGMNINLNHEAFYTFSYDSEYKLDTI